MTISTKHNKNETSVRIKRARFVGDMLYVILDDGREIGLALKKVKWLKWLARATAQQRRRWKIDPWGDAIYWDELDDGIELGHLMSMRALTH